MGSAYLDGYQRAPRIILKVPEEVVLANEGQGVGEMGLEPFKDLFFRVKLLKLRRRGK